MLQAPARENISRGGERGDDGVVCVALVALIGDDTLAFEAGGVGGVKAVLVDGVGDAGVDSTLREHAAARHPDVEVVAAMTGRGVDEARAGVVGDVVAVE